MSPSLNDTIIEIVITEDDLDHKRLDKCIHSHIPDLSRSIIKSLFEDGHINSESSLALKKLPPVGTKIVIKIPPPAPTDLVAQDIPLNILFEDEHLVVIDKDAGLVVHPAAGNPDGTLVNAILFHCKDLKGIGNEQRPGIVHRLDKGTSGVMIVAKTAKAHEELVNMFSKHDLTRKYTAIIVAVRNLQDKGVINSLIARSKNNRLKMTSKTNNGKNAKTHYEVQFKRGGLAIVEFTLHTGRTHQIRVHTSEQLNSPILLDELYGNPKNHLKHIPSELMPVLKNYPHPLLHAKHLSFKHPITKEELSFETSPPSPHFELQNWIKDNEC